MDTKNIFIEGAIQPSLIAESIAKHNTKKNIGAHSIFLGQVRNDKIDENEVIGIDYSCYREMAEEKFHKIKESVFEKYSLNCIHIFHSLGVVNSGEISLFIMTSSKHRSDAIESCEYLVNRIKNEVPIWGKEIISGGNYSWKKNS